MNDGYRFHLLGKFQATFAGSPIPCLTRRKLQELVCYLLLFRERPHCREVLADGLWDTARPAQSRKYLRQALWQLAPLRRAWEGQGPLLHLDGDWVRINLQGGLWLDVAELEAAFVATRDVPGAELDPDQAAAAEDAVQPYRGALLEGWTQEWCLFERERLKSIYFALLEKLVGWCEATGRPERAAAFVERMLRADRAHEEAHRLLMRLSCIRGDRAAALRQFEICRAALRHELGAEPDRLTLALYESILTGGYAAGAGRFGESSTIRMVDHGAVSPAENPPLTRLREVAAALSDAQRLVRQSLETLRVT